MILNKRLNGVLMHISSLPGKTGIGTLGVSAYNFVDFLKESKQAYWQILPVGPTSFGDSPYQSFSTFAGNPYFIDLDMLCDEGFLDKSDYEKINWGKDINLVDYGLVYEQRQKVFECLFNNFKKKVPSDFDFFCSENYFWLEDYAFFMALKDEHNGIPFYQWEKGLVSREEKSLAEWKKKCSDKITCHKMLQYFFYKQWFALKNYANVRGIKIIGDIPFYVSGDSSDVWSNPEQFDLDENFVPIEVAGCPPDAFSADGQLWGNPVYKWDYMKKTDYAWWKKRLQKSLEIYDVLRIDHFRGFDSYYCIPYGAKDARNGHWRNGPGMDLFNSIKKQFGDELPIIAEDLGFLTDSVKKLLADSTFPGMKILQFAFDSREESDYLPYRYTQNCVVYTGTHDNDTILGWCETARTEDVEQAKKYLRVSDKDSLRKEMMICAMASPANTCILCMQDLIGLGKEARMNIPSTVGTNWKWRASADMMTSGIKEFLSYYSELYGRI